ncbi:hypothetical protein GQ53DRAFT_828807 [Thozetella sp. PMI_491]|nr:hypothetical protein GQ53DRAFT_828807 [Thozetella sp. PMI_491]
MSATEPEPQCGDACLPLAPGQPAMSLEKAQFIEESIKAKLPDYEPGKVMESAMLLNDIKPRLDARDPKLFEQFMHSFTVTGGEKIQKGDTEEQIKEKIKQYDIALGVKNARKFIEEEPDLLERFDALHKDTLAKNASTTEQASTEEQDSAPDA